MSWRFGERKKTEEENVRLKNEAEKLKEKNKALEKDVAHLRYTISRQEEDYASKKSRLRAEVLRELQREIESLNSQIRNREDVVASIHAQNKEIEKSYINKLEFYKSFHEELIPDTIKRIASLYADIQVIDNRCVEERLRHQVPRPALKAADEIKAIRKEKREALRQLKEMQYEYDWLLQQLPDYADSTQDVIEEIEAIAAEGDEVELWLSKDEWQNLSTIEKNQLALDRYNQRSKKSNRRIGYDYELYCGHYIYIGELLGGRGISKIIQYGIENGLEDRGRDIIAEGNGMVYVIQCKCWRKERPIRENTIMQLYGSAAEYCFSQYGSELNPLKRLHKTVVPVLITTTTLSEVATRFAKYLGIEVVQFAFDKPYPQIKCNIGRNGERIYHLPFDQQYDTTVIQMNRGECFVRTVKEAEDLGYRHAMRHNHVEG